MSRKWRGEGEAKEARRNEKVKAKSEEKQGKAG